MSRILGGAQRIRIGLLCAEGEEHADAGQLGEALACFMEAWELLPEPREEFGDADRVLRGFTRVLRARGDLATGLEIMLGSRARSALAMARGLSRHRD